MVPNKTIDTFTYPQFLTSKETSTGERCNQQLTRPNNTIVGRLRQSVLLSDTSSTEGSIPSTLTIQKGQLVFERNTSPASFTLRWLNKIQPPPDTPVSLNLQTVNQFEVEVQSITPENRLEIVLSLTDVNGVEGSQLFTTDKTGTIAMPIRLFRQNCVTPPATASETCTQNTLTNMSLDVSCIQGIALSGSLVEAGKVLLGPLRWVLCGE
jgi:hypothetical protein